MNKVKYTSEQLTLFEIDKIKEVYSFNSEKGIIVGICGTHIVIDFPSGQSIVPIKSMIEKDGKYYI